MNVKRFSARTSCEACSGLGGLDPACDVRDSPSEALCALVAAQLRLDAGAADAVAAPAWRVSAPMRGALNPN